ncbi:hypothetical protein [Hymenobacter yonginensis]|uniref:Uncharacterized protein n=1 Tax=Hymenobacter yonginensis TaxID=748197 RepID=A0ABY7PTP2_9BACT|nr:hypothetical protein [Hymenobacter yonginensis]WBO85924.1 hypothetical protein O9Z63_06645 [Hymenobacter yonginensis]
MDIQSSTHHPLAQSDTGKATLAAANATILYLLAYLLLQGLYQLSTICMAARLGIRGVWQLGRVQFQMADAEWWQAAVLAVYGIGPVVCGGMALAALAWFWKRARLQRGLFKQFLLWVMLHGCNLSLGVLAADTLTQSGAWYVPSWLFRAGNGLNVGVAILAAAAQIGLGFLAARVFLQSHDSITLMQHHNRRRLLLATVVVPWVVGSLLLAAFYFPAQTLTEQLHAVLLLLLLGPMGMASSTEFFEGTIAQPGRPRLALGLLLLLAGALVVGRLVLARGVPFG